MRGADYQGCLACSFIFEEFCLPAGILWCSIFFLWTCWQVFHCSGPVPGSVVAELAYVRIPKEAVTKRASGFAVYAFLEPHFLSRLSLFTPHQAFDWTYCPASFLRCWVAFSSPVQLRGSCCSFHFSRRQVRRQVSVDPSSFLPCQCRKLDCLSCPQMGVQDSWADSPFSLL